MHASVPESLELLFLANRTGGARRRVCGRCALLPPGGSGLQRFLTASPLESDGVKEVAEAVRDHDETAAPDDVEEQVDHNPFSMIAWPRWVLSASTVSRLPGSVMVKNAWNR